VSRADAIVSSKVRNKKMYRLYAVLALVLISCPAFAADLTLMAGHQFNGDFAVSTFDEGTSSSLPLVDNQSSDIELEKGAVFGLALDFVFRNNPNQRIGLFLSNQETDFDPDAGLPDARITVTHAHFTAMNYYPSGNFEPFVLAGVGAGFFSPKDSGLTSETRFSAQLGAGANYKITENLLLRFDVRWLPTFFNGSGSAFCSGGCIIRLKSDTYNQLQINSGLMFRF